MASTETKENFKHNIELYKDPFYDLPKSDSGISFKKFVEHTLEEYIKRLDNFNGIIADEINEERENIINLCKSINSSIDYALLGLTAKSYYELKKGVESVKKYLLYRKPEAIPIQRTANNSIEKTFRIREKFGSAEKSDLFHIPFERRNLTTSNRFSIPGLPCLYLSNSVYLCWEELNQPSSKNLFVSRFDYDSNKIKLINMAYTPAKTIQFNEPRLMLPPDKRKYIFFIESLISWPLIFACHVHVQCRQDPFIIEYVIPQHIMQWCRESSDLDGVKYTSTRSKYIFFNSKPLNQENIAFPVQSTDDKGYCTNLRNKLTLTDPIKISEYKYLKNLKLSSEDLEIWIGNNGGGYINHLIRKIVTGEKQPSIFDRVEIELLKKKVEKLSIPC